MSFSSPDGLDTAGMLRAFEQRLASSVPFREDTSRLSDLNVEVRPVLEVLARAYRERAGVNSAMHEGFALFTLLCRRAGVLGATPTASIAVLNAVLAALCTAGIELSPQDREQLMMVAVEGYTAGRDEAREHALRAIAADSQVWHALAPRCFGLFLAGTHHPEQLEQVLERCARELFRADVRAVLVDLSRLHNGCDENARVVADFGATLVSLGARLIVYGADATFRVWFDRLHFAEREIEHIPDFARAHRRALELAGYELRSRGRFADLLSRRRASTR